MIKRTLAALSFATALVCPSFGQAADLRIIVDRFEDSVEVFVSLPASSVPALLGGTTDALTSADGTFEIGVFRETGTAVEGDAVFGGTRLLVDGRPAEVEAMSVMVHPADLPVPLETPIDGVAAMSICTVPPSETAPRMEDLQLYGGFIAWPVDGFADIALTLANERQADVWVGHFANGRKVGAETLSIGPRGRIDLASNPGVLSRQQLAGGAGMMAVMLGWVVFVGVRARTERARNA